MTEEPSLMVVRGCESRVTTTSHDVAIRSPGGTRCELSTDDDPTEAAIFVMVARGENTKHLEAGLRASLGEAVEASILVWSREHEGVIGEQTARGMAKAAAHWGEADDELDERVAMLDRSCAPALLAWAMRAVLPGDGLQEQLRRETAASILGVDLGSAEGDS